MEDACDEVTADERYAESLAETYYDTGRGSRADLAEAIGRVLSVVVAERKARREAQRALAFSHEKLGWAEGPHTSPDDCPTYYDGCHCLVETLVHNIARAEKAEGDVKRLRSALIRAGLAVGGFVGEETSTDFLMHVPEEVEAVIAKWADKA